MSQIRNEAKDSLASLPASHGNGGLSPPAGRGSALDQHRGPGPAAAELPLWAIHEDLWHWPLCQGVLLPVQKGWVGEGWAQGGMRLSSGSHRKLCAGVLGSTASLVRTKQQRLLPQTAGALGAGLGSKAGTLHGIQPGPGWGQRQGLGLSAGPSSILCMGYEERALEGANRDLLSSLRWSTNSGANWWRRARGRVWAGSQRSVTFSSWTEVGAPGLCLCDWAGGGQAVVGVQLPSLSPTSCPGGGEGWGRVFVSEQRTAAQAREWGCFFWASSRSTVHAREKGPFCQGVVGRGLAVSQKEAFRPPLSKHQVWLVLC